MTIVEILGQMKATSEALKTTATNDEEAAYYEGRVDGLQDALYAIENAGVVA